MSLGFSFSKLAAMLSFKISIIYSKLIRSIYHIRDDSMALVFQCSLVNMDGTLFCKNGT